MIPVERDDVFEASLRLLQDYGDGTSIRGRFVLVYLGLRKMGNAIASLGSAHSTPASEIEDYLDRLYTKIDRPEPLIVLTSPFGQNTSPRAPWSTRTGEVAPGNSYPTNTWRNNLNVQKGIGCPADPETIRSLLGDPLGRLRCPSLMTDEEGHQQCGVTGTNYRGDEHSIWLGMTETGYQAVDLDQPTVYEPYLAPKGQRVPIFPLISVLYHAAPVAMYPSRGTVGVPEFCQDFGLNVDRAVEIFDCEVDSPANSEIINMAPGGMPPWSTTAGVAATLPGHPLPSVPDATTLNTGVGAEIAVASYLQMHNWTVSYTGNVRGVGYDLEARQDDNTLRVEVKSSVSLCTPVLTHDEWQAARTHGDEYVLAVVDFFGSPGQQVSYVRNPAANLVPVTRQVTTYRVSRDDVSSLGVGVEFL